MPMSGRIDKAHLVPIYEPDFPVGRLRDRRPEALEDRNQPHSIRRHRKSSPGCIRFGSAIQASKSVRATRRSPHCVYSQ